MTGIKLYKTKIDLDNYTVQIDSTVSVTVTLLDFNNNPVKSESVTLTCSKGKFTDTNYAQSTKTTNNNGKATFSYEATEWGFINLKANNNSVGIFVTGWKDVSDDWTLWGDNFYFYDYYDNDNLQYRPKAYVDDSINHMILKYYWKTGEELWAGETMGQCGDYISSNSKPYYSPWETLKSSANISISNNTTQNKTYSLGLDDVSFYIDFTLSWEMTTTTTSSILCFSPVNQYDYNNPPKSDHRIGLGIWTDGNIGVSVRKNSEEYDNNHDSDNGIWPLNTWVSCEILKKGPDVHFFVNDNYITSDFARFLNLSSKYGIYLLSWAQSGNVAIRNLRIQNQTDYHYPAVNVKTSWYRPDILFTLNSQREVSVRSEYDANPNPGSDYPITFEFDFNSK